jgi:phosphocarrier protein FPr
MVGLVIVSHSRSLANALVDLVKQVSRVEVPIAVAAGVGPDGEEFGTNAVEIAEAIQSVYSQDGVLVLMDLGSAILSAEMALELLPAEMHERLLFCSAPLVEGAISAGVQAGLGKDLESVCREAREALVPKAQQLGQTSEAVAPAEPPPVEGDPNRREIELSVRNEHGLHARPAARFVQTAASFEADVQVRNLSKGRGPVSASSLNAIAGLGVGRGDRIAISAAGPQAEQALQALRSLVEVELVEAEPEAADLELPPPGSEAAVPEGAIQAVPVSGGIAIGPLYGFRPTPPPVAEGKIDRPKQAWDQLETARSNTRRTIQDRRRQTAASLGEPQAAIFDAHLLILDDPMLLERVRERIFRERINPAQAWHESITEAAGALQALEDPYLAQRAADVLDVGSQVLYELVGKANMGQVELPEPVILLARDLTPSQTAQLDLSKILGLATVAGGPTSHSAILARSMGIPAVAGVDPAIDALPDGTTLALDGFEGWIWVNPDPQRLAGLQERKRAFAERLASSLQASREQAVTVDGQRIEVAANAGSAADAELAVKNGAEGIGLLRTEFLFLTRETPPSEEEQLQALQQVGQALGDLPITVRTLDVGGDKPLQYINLPQEANPFLGLRAIRLSLREPGLFQAQLRAILRAGADHHLRVMFPMVATLEEVDQARQALEAAHSSLEAEGLPHRWPIETGIMVETPAAALLSEAIAPRVDFFSLGTNDLTQYTLAAERGNPAVANLADALHPAVLQLIARVARAAEDHGKWAGVCGELAGEVLAAPLLVGLGVRELSANPPSVPEVKAVIRKFSLTAAQDLAQQALAAKTAEEVRGLCKQFLREAG